MLNKVMLIGRLGSDPDLKATQSGMPICRMRLALDETYTDRDGNRVERTEWVTVVAFSKTAENCSLFLRKGSMVYAEGRLTSRKWQDTQSGQERTSVEIRADRVLFLEPKSKRDMREESPAVRSPLFDNGRQEPERPVFGEPLDDMPF